MIKRKYGFVKTLALGLCLAALAGCGTDGPSLPQRQESETDKTWQSQENAPAYDPKSNIPCYYVGDSIQDLDLKLQYIASGEFQDYDPQLAPAEGNRYIYLRFAVENTGSGGDMSIGSMGFECYADGVEGQWVMVADDDLSGTLSPGRKMLGSVYFEVPRDAEVIEVEYVLDVFTDERVKFVYQGEKDTGYVAQKNATPSPCAAQKGEAVQVDSWKMTLLESSWLEEEGHIAPPQGCGYVSCLVELENVSQKDIYISEFEFDCYADGWSCQAAYIRSDSIGGSLAPGEKIQGWVTFAVPVDVQTLEVEYVPFEGTSSPMVVSAKPE